MGGKVESLLKDYCVIASEGQVFRLNLNCYKCELITNDAVVVTNFRAISPNIVHALPSTANFLGSPIRDVATTKCALSFKLKNLLLLGKRLKLLNVHDAIFFLKNCFRISKLMHLLRSTRCYALETSVKYDKFLHDIMESVLNITLSSNACDQATSPVYIFGLHLGLDIQKATRLVLLAYLSSVSGSADIQLNILLDRLHESSAADDGCFINSDDT